MEENNEALIQSLKKTARFQELKLKLEKGDYLNLEEMSILNLIMQIQAQSENRIQVRAAIALSEKTVQLTEKTTELTKDHVKTSKRVALWIMFLAFATFALALAAFLNLIRK